VTNTWSEWGVVNVYMCVVVNTTNARSLFPPFVCVVAVIATNACVRGVMVLSWQVVFLRKSDYSSIYSIYKVRSDLCQTCVYKFICIFVYICLYVYMYIFIYIFIHT